jgi:four helix bundle protein
MFSHEKLEVYKRSLEFVDLVLPVLKQLPRGNREIVDQLKRASISLLLNIAEGAGKAAPDDKKRYYSIARGSTLECAAIFDLLLRWRLIDHETNQICKAKLLQIASMLSKLVIK